MTSEGPYAPPPGALALLDVDESHLNLVVNRRGSTVWKARTGDGPYAVKVGYPSRTHSWTALAPAREAAVLAYVTHERVLSGRWNGGTWSAQPWRQGTSLYDRWAPCRGAEKSSPDLADAMACARELAKLHERGLVHGDVQPAHFVLDRHGRAFLIDLALARGFDVPHAFDFPYRGCLVHYEAPEISRSVLANGTAEPTRASDVYALGASLMISATGWRHVAYPDDAPREVQRQAIVDQPHRPVRIPGGLGTLVEAMLSYEPGDRPTAEEVWGALAISG